MEATRNAREKKGQVMHQNELPTTWQIIKFIIKVIFALGVFVAALSRSW